MRISELTRLNRIGFVALALIFSLANVGLMLAQTKFARHQWDIRACWYDGGYTKVSSTCQQNQHPIQRLTAVTDSLLSTNDSHIRALLLQTLHFPSVPPDLPSPSAYAHCHSLWDRILCVPLLHQHPFISNPFGPARRRDLGFCPIQRTPPEGSNLGSSSICT
jgi:hypothetical protein